MNKSAYYILSSIYFKSHFGYDVLDKLSEAKYSKTMNDCVDLDLELLVKHCSQATRANEKKFFVLFIFFVILILGRLILPLEYLVLFVLTMYLITYTYLVIRELSKNKFIRTKIKDNDLNDLELTNYDSALVEKVRKYKANGIHYFKQYNPFSIFGQEIGSWSIPIDITKSNGDKKKESISSFDNKDVYEMITNQLNKLNFENFESEDFIFVNANDIVKNNNFYSKGKLINQPDKELINSLISTRSEKARYYKVYKIKDWNNEMVFTILFRAHKSYENLYIETKFFLMPSLIGITKEIDEFKSRSSLSEVFTILMSSFVSVPILLLFSPLMILKRVSKEIDMPKIIRKVFRNKELEKKVIGNNIDINRIFRKNYSEYYFQIMDRDFYLKAVEKRILNALTSFLEDRNIDVSEFKENRTYILNNGIMMSGGEMKGSNISVGNKNKITENNTTKN